MGMEWMGRSGVRAESAVFPAGDSAGSVGWFVIPKSGKWDAFFPSSDTAEEKPAGIFIRLAGVSAPVGARTGNRRK